MNSNCVRDILPSDPVDGGVVLPVPVPRQTHHSTSFKLNSSRKACACARPPTRSTRRLFIRRPYSFLFPCSASALRSPSRKQCHCQFHRSSSWIQFSYGHQHDDCLVPEKVGVVAWNGESKESRRRGDTTRGTAQPEMSGNIISYHSPALHTFILTTSYLFQY